MSETIIIHSFGFNDRGGKVRWLAEELDLDVQEQNVEFGAQRKFPYRDKNPYGAIPAVEFRNETMIESNAICQFLSETFPDKALTILAGDSDRFAFLRMLSICSENLEGRSVEYLLGKVGILPKEYCELHQKTLEFKFRILTEEIPKDGYLVGGRFTIVDIIAAYSLRLAIVAGLIDFAEVENYLNLLASRPASKRANFFTSIEDKFSAQ